MIRDTLHFGLKEHTAVDSKHGLVMATTYSPASVYDANYLSYCATFEKGVLTGDFAMAAEYESELTATGQEQFQYPYRKC